MKKLNYLPVLLFIMLLLGKLSAQKTEYLNANNIKPGIGIGGNLFTMIDTSINFLLYEAPKGSGKRPVFTASLWMSGLDSDQNSHCAAQRYTQLGRDFFDGPMAAVYNAAYDSYYRRVFKITRAQVTYFRGLHFPVMADQLDTAILQWPGKGNAFVHAAYGVDIETELAPFFDTDGDGIYNPLNGDFPFFCGDEAIFFILNDDRYPHTESNGEKLGVEIRGLACVFADSAPVIQLYDKRAINNTVFVQYQIQNKSANSYKSFYLGLFEDPDLGCFNNDRVGCDTTRNLMFVYNGDTIDNNCGIDSGYGTMPVTQGVKILNRQMSSFGYFTNGAFASQADPASCPQYRDYLEGYSADGTPFSAGGTGYNSNGYQTKFMFPGDPNDTTQWSEEQASEGLSAGDRRMYGGIGPMDFNAGETKQFDFAFITSYDSTSNRLKIVDTLKRDADIIQQFYDNQIVACRSALPTGIAEVNKDEVSIWVFPNPGNKQITISATQSFQFLEITDMEGRLVYKQNVNGNKAVVDVSSFAKGIYLLQINSEVGLGMKKVVIN